METPTEYHAQLEKTAVFLSASVPQELVGSPRAQELYSAIVLLVQRVTAEGGRLVFGGHPTITPVVRETLKRADRRDAVELYQLRRFEKEAPEDIHDDAVFHRVHWIEPEGGISGELSEMRDQMAEAASAAVFIGGKTADFYGEIPGLRDEYQRFLAHHPDGPVYLVGMMGGETGKLIQEMEDGEQSPRNGLSEAEREVVHHSHSVDLVMSLVLKDLAAMTGRRNSGSGAGFPVQTGPEAFPKAAGVGE